MASSTSTSTRLGGADNITVGDLSGHRRQPGEYRPQRGRQECLTARTIRSRSTPPQVPNSFGVRGGSSGITVFGLEATTKVTFADATDHLTLNGQAGDDTIDASGLGWPAPYSSRSMAALAPTPSAAVTVTTSSPVATANDVARMGDGKRHVRVESGRRQRHGRRPGRPATRCCSTARTSNETVNIFANGSHAAFTRDVAAVTMDIDNIETVTFTARGGVDNINIGDMTATDVKQINLDLAAVPGNPAPDGRPWTRLRSMAPAGADVIFSLFAGEMVRSSIDGTLASRVVIDHFRLQRHGPNQRSWRRRCDRGIGCRPLAVRTLCSDGGEGGRHSDR